MPSIGTPTVSFEEVTRLSSEKWSLTSVEPATNSNRFTSSIIIRHLCFFSVEQPLTSFRIRKHVPHYTFYDAKAIIIEPKRSAGIVGEKVHIGD
jgi:hypothetical protein